MILKFKIKFFLIMFYDKDKKILKELSFGKKY